MDNFKDKQIAILGYGLEGKSLVSFILNEEPAAITIFDQKDLSLLSEHKKENVKLEKTSFESIDFSLFDIVFRSPGINPDKINCPREKTSSLIDLFLSRAPGKLVGVTGTKGKSSTVLLIEKILKLNQKQVFIGGNIGSSPLEFLDELTQDSYTILEVSSFQLIDLKNDFDIAVILPVIKDHLDYHKDIEEYFEAKRRIFLNSSDTRIIAFTGNKDLLGLEGLPNEISLYDESSEEQALIDVSSSCQIPLVDVIAAYYFSKIENLKFNSDEIIKDFKKLPYRMELIGKIGNTSFYNDSASTNPISTEKAIGLISGTTGLIIGGASKEIPIDELVDSIVKNEKIKQIYLYGEQANTVKSKLEESSYDREFTTYNTLAEVVDNLDLEVENIIFSPAFASFDQYENYKERGEHFNELFEKLKCKNT